MTSTIQLSGFLRKEPYPLLLWSLVVVLAIRILLYLLMSSAGYFYGIPWDTFSRTSLAWQWAHQPYFSQSDGNWPPFQFWIVGTTFMVLRPWVDTSSLMVPVITNNLFFAGSVLVTCLMAYRLGGQTAVLWAAILVAFFPADVFVSYSGLTEPMSIFFILYVSYILATTFLDGKTQQSGWSIKVGIATLFATATHYIGWFLAFFVIVFVDYWAVRPLLRRRLGQIALCAVSIILCVIFPVLWLINNFVLWGDPLHFARIAAGYQAAYVGQLTILKRAGIPFKVLLTTFPTLCVLGVVGIVYAMRKDIQKIVYLAPATFLFAMLWLTTLFAYAAPYQEPRYMVIFGWAVIPFVAVWLSSLWLTKTLLLRSVVAGLIIAVIAISLFEVFHFTNSFGPDVREVASRAAQWLRSQPADAHVIIQGVSFAETGVIPVAAGYPDRFIVIDDGRWREPNQASTIFANAMAQKQMVIVKDAVMVYGADWDKIELERLGSYLIILPKAVP